ncbi:hypothetical protein MLD38_037259 [Melastoma candidum]|nr:hypothetical protein MLD38_037259 [Melastoma candidum]
MAFRTAPICGCCSSLNLSDSTFIPVNFIAAYTPHISLIYGDISDQRKKKAQEKANILDENLNCLSFKISRLVLCKSVFGDLATKSVFGS